MQYQCMLGIDFMQESKLTLDFDQKSLIIPDDQIKQLPKVEKPVEIDLSDTKLGEGQKQKLKDLFNDFKGLFSDQPGLTHVLYHEIDTGDKGPVVSRPYRYETVKQGIIDYHIGKILPEGSICPIQSPYASPVVLTRKNNGLPPDSPEAYRFAIDYRKLNAITKYPRYPLPSKKKNYALKNEKKKLRFEQLRLDEQKRKDEFELEKLRIQTQSKLGADTSKESDTKFLVKEISKFIHRFDLKEDISLYLKLFERQAQRLNIDQENWVSHLLGLLPTEVSHIIAREPDDKANSYEHVKDLLLKRFKLTPEKFRQLFVTHQKHLKEHGLIFTMS
ncbi:uncharacterized protein TNCV_3647991 [Trichonephila clavipes]|nr:uncharacterized protein TNCV_3647991 [Trichonephila clavipes]